MKIKVITNLLIVVIIVGAISFSVYSFFQLRQIRNSSQSINQKDIDSLISKVAKIYLAPNEVPTIATVSDPQALKDQSFFTLSEKGDKVLIFSKAGKAVLYRPNINKIIEITPVKSNPLTY